MANDFLAEYIAAGGPDIDHLRNVVQFIVNQDLTPLSEPERADLLHRAHLALGFPPESGAVCVVPKRDTYDVGGELVKAERPYVNLEGLNALAARYGASTRILSTAFHENGVVVTMRAELPDGRFRERAGYCVNAHALDKGRPAVDIACEHAANQVLYGLFGLPMPDDTLGKRYLERQIEGIKEALGPETNRVEGDALPSAQEPVATSVPVPAAEAAPAAPPPPAQPQAVDPEMASLEAMGMGDPDADCFAPPDFAAVEASNSLPPGWQVAERTRRRQPWPYQESKITSPGEFKPPPSQVDAYVRLLAERGVTSGEEQRRFTGRLMTGADVSLNHYLLPVRDLRRCMEEVRSLASSNERQELDMALADRGYLDGPERAQKLLKLVGVRTPRDQDFLSSRDIAGAMRTLSDEPTLTQVAECQILMEHLGLKEPQHQEMQAMKYLGRTDPVPLSSLSAKEIGQCIKTMQPSVQAMKTKTMFPSNRQRHFPWSPRL